MCQVYGPHSYILPPLTLSSDAIPIETRSPGTDNQALGEQRRPAAQRKLTAPAVVLQGHPFDTRTAGGLAGSMPVAPPPAGGWGHSASRAGATADSRVANAYKPRNTTKANVGANVV